MGKTFKDRKKFDRKHDRTDDLKEQKREPRKGKWVAPLEEDDDVFIDDNEY